jgi:hypothetical protein
MGIGLSVDCVGQLMLHCMLKVVLMLFRLLFERLTCQHACACARMKG